MNTSKALLDAILADPLDELPRKVYADWWEENGDANGLLMAEFVRLQLAGNNPERQRELLDHLQKVNLVGSPFRAFLPHEKVPDECNQWVVYRRGWPSEVGLSTPVWCDWGKPLVRMKPLLYVTLTDLRPFYDDHGNELGSLNWTYLTGGILQTPKWAARLEEILGGMNTWHPSEVALLDAISNSALAWARR